MLTDSIGRMFLTLVALAILIEFIIQLMKTACPRITRFRYVCVWEVIAMFFGFLICWFLRLNIFDLTSVTTGFGWRIGMVCTGILAGRMASIIHCWFGRSGQTHIESKGDKRK